MNDTKILLKDSEIPRNYYNIIPELPKALAPYRDGQTKKDLDPSALEAIFPRALIEQEVSTKTDIEIPEPILEIYQQYRATPLIRAKRLEKALNTPARIYYKYEGVSPAGSHKTNTAIAQAYYNKQEGVKRLVTETGAGQWGSALSLAGAYFGLDISVYMVRVSFEQKPYRKTMVQTYGGEIFASPSTRTNAGKSVLAKDAESAGSLGIAISEAVEDAVSSKNSNYALGSVLNHVLLHQTIIGLEAKKQLEIAGDYPDVVIACHGGGSNFGGITLPFMRDVFAGKQVRFVAAEPVSCPTLTKGEFRYDFGDNAGLTPMMKMYTLGSDFVPPEIHAGGLRYHGASPLVSHLLNLGLIEAVAYDQLQAFEAALVFAKTEGIIPAPEASHAICATIKEALKAKEEQKERVILFNLSGHGNFDMTAYEKYLSGEIKVETYEG